MDINSMSSAASSWNARGSEAVANSKAPKSSSGDVLDAVYENGDKSVKVEDFLNLMITQLKNQDFMNPMDDTQYVTQLAQFATMQQMQELAYYSKSNYVMSLVGKDVTMAKMSVGGNVEKITGPVEKISLYKNEYHIQVDGKSFELNQLMEINGDSVQKTPEDTKKPEAPETSGNVVSVGKTTDTEASISWLPAKDDKDKEDELQYTVYYSTNKNMSTIADVKKGIRYGEENRENLTGEKLEGLVPDTMYYVNILVRDSDGNESVYGQSIVKTEKKSEKEL